MWTKLKAHFTNQTGSYRELAMEAWLAYSYSDSTPVEENLPKYKKLTYNLTESGATIQDNTLYARLLSALPPSWSSFKQAWSAGADTSKSLTTLMNAIRNEVIRQKVETAKDKHAEGSFVLPHGGD